MNQCQDCHDLITTRQHKLQCSACGITSHRKCAARGMSSAEYHGIIRTVPNTWRCQQCSFLPPDRPDPIQISGLDDEDEYMINAGEPLESTRDEPMDTTTPNADVTAANFDIDLSYGSRSNHEESTLHDISMSSDSDSDSEPDEITYKVLPTGSQRGAPLLVVSGGAKFVHKKKYPSGKVLWRCSVRTCNATISQAGDVFTPGPQPHNHTILIGADTAAVINNQVKTEAKDDIFRPVPTIVQDTMTEHFPTGSLPPGAPKPANIIRNANRQRQSLRPQEPLPDDIGFALDEDWAEDTFLLKDIVLKNNGIAVAHHAVFASKKQLDLLSKSNTWYLDGTFKIVSKPFTQMFSISAFVKGPQGNTRQIPLAYALMSRRRRQDYKKVLNAIKSALPNRAAVQRCMMDFEKGMWRAVTDVLGDDVETQGCNFHFSQVNMDTYDLIHNSIRVI